jgi:hypothetical protein
MIIYEIPIQESDVQCDKKIPLTEHIPLQKGLRLNGSPASKECVCGSQSIFHYKKD